MPTGRQSGRIYEVRYNNKREVLTLRVSVTENQRRRGIIGSNQSVRNNLCIKIKKLLRSEYGLELRWVDWDDLEWKFKARDRNTPAPTQPCSTTQQRLFSI